MSQVTSAIVVALMLACVSGVTAQVVIETVTVGNPGNVGELSGRGHVFGFGAERTCGAVDYVYDIGKFEVTAGHYTEFLNAVAAKDAYGLYNTDMSDDAFGCQIKRAGLAGSYTYSVAKDWADRPVNHVTWASAARFANWLHNGQPTGSQDFRTTEDGSYYLNHIVWGDPAILAVVREEDATWVIPSEDEWYKAAYHKNDGVTGNYYDYTTSSDTVPSNDLIDPDPGNNATFYDIATGYTIGSPYYRTEVGAHENSKSPYDTFDQGGNVSEWIEGSESWNRGIRGGSIWHDNDRLHAIWRDWVQAMKADLFIGFRVANASASGCVDVDVDGDVDLYDLAFLQAAFDGDVDSHYFACFETALSGPR